MEATDNDPKRHIPQKACNRFRYPIRGANVTEGRRIFVSLVVSTTRCAHSDE